MKVVSHPFKSDYIYLSFFDVIKLLLGFKVKDGATNILRKKENG